VVADQIPPTLVSGDFHYQSLPHAVSFVFSEDIGSSVDGDEVTFRNLTTATDVTPSGYAWDASTNTLRFTFSGILADGNYRAALHAGNIRDAAGNPLDGNGDGSGGDDATFDFYFLNADTNRDRHVNFADLVTMAQHYNESGYPWALGDHNYDGFVNFADLVILAQRYNTTLAPPPLPGPALLTAMRSSTATILTDLGTTTARSARVFASAKPVRVRDLQPVAVKRPVVKARAATFGR
jgi:hypothetical protein